MSEGNNEMRLRLVERRSSILEHENTEIGQVFVTEGVVLKINVNLRLYACHFFLIRFTAI